MEILERKTINWEKKQRKGEISERVVDLINQTIKNPGDNFADRINSIMQKAINTTKQDGNKIDEECQKKAFNEVCLFLNGLFKKCEIKKFYNYIPNISLTEYANKNIGEELINNIYGKEWKLFYKEEIKGGSCYHRTVLLKKIFEKIKENGLEIESKILVYKAETGHSAVLVKFQDQIYIADIHGFNESSKKIINSTKELNKIYQTDEFSKFSFEKTQEGNKLYFDRILDFTKYIDSKKVKTAVIEFKPRLENHEEKEVKISFGEGFIELIINGKKHKYNINKIISRYEYKSGYETINYILKNIQGTKEEKQELGKYLNMIVNKVNRGKVIEIYTQAY